MKDAHVPGSELVMPGDEMVMPGSKWLCRGVRWLCWGVRWSCRSRLNCVCVVQISLGGRIQVRTTSDCQDAAGPVYTVGIEA